jgi:hypothetical protein
MNNTTGRRGSMEYKEVLEMDAMGMARVRKVPYTMSLKIREKFEIWLARVSCYLFNRPYKCYVFPKKMRDNQVNSVFFSNFPLGKNVSIYQFDIKGDKDKWYHMDEKEFMEHWEILSYVGKAEKQFDRFDRLIKEKKLYHTMPFRRVDYINTKFNGKIVSYHA